VTTRESAVPDYLGPGARVVFVGINPGEWSARARAPFANPGTTSGACSTPPGSRRGYWSRRRPISSSRSASGSRTPRAGRRADRETSGRPHFAGAAGRLEEIARTYRPEVLAFVGKAAFQGTFGGRRAEHGLQERKFDGTALFVLPSTSPANAAVSWDERLRWFRALRELVA
jgi:TDG/mug DNA glycosylase family protein